MLTVTPNQSGTLTGTNTITIAFNNGISTSTVGAISVTVEDAATLSIGANFTLHTSATKQLTATITPTTGFDNVPNYTWESSTTSVATVNTTGLVTASITIGTTTITLTAAGKTATAVATVITPPAHELFGTWQNVENWVDGAHTYKNTFRYSITNNLLTYSTKSETLCNTGSDIHNHYPVGHTPTFHDNFKATFAINEGAKTFTLSNTQFWDNGSPPTLVTPNPASFTDHVGSHAIDCFTPQCVKNSYETGSIAHDASHRWMCNESTCKSSRLGLMHAEYAAYNAPHDYKKNGTVANFLFKNRAQVFSRVSGAAGGFAGEWTSINTSSGSTVIEQYKFTGGNTIQFYQGGSWQNFGTFAQSGETVTITPSGQTAVVLYYQFVSGTPEKLYMFFYQDFTKLP